MQGKEFKVLQWRSDGNLYYGGGNGKKQNNWQKNLSGCGVGGLGSDWGSREGSLVSLDSILKG